MSSDVTRYSRVTGALYLLTHVTAVAAVAAYANVDTVRLGVALEFLLALGCLGTGVLLWHLLRAHGPVRAASFAALRVLEAAVIGAATLPMLAVALTDSFGEPLGDALVEVHRAGFLIGQGMIISVNTVILGWLLLDARAVPRSLASPWTGRRGDRARRQRPATLRSDRPGWRDRRSHRRADLHVRDLVRVHTPHSRPARRSRIPQPPTSFVPADDLVGRFRLGVEALPVGAEGSARGNPDGNEPIVVDGACAPILALRGARRRHLVLG